MSVCACGGGVCLNGENHYEHIVYGIYNELQNTCVGDRPRGFMLLPQCMSTRARSTRRRLITASNRISETHTFPTDIVFHTHNRMHAWYFYEHIARIRKYTYTEHAHQIEYMAEFFGAVVRRGMGGDLCSALYVV